MARIGLVAGEGKLPMVFARVAKEKGDTVIAFGLKGITSPDLEKYVDKLHWVPWGSLQKAILLLATERIRKIVMLGKIKKDVLSRDESDMTRSVGALKKADGAVVIDTTSLSIQEVVDKILSYIK